MKDKRLRRKEIQKKYLQFISLLTSNSPLPGEWESVFKGSGFELAGIREFQPGDEIKKIHWPSTLKTQRLHIIERISQRELQALILLDVSSSMQIPEVWSQVISATGILTVSALHFGTPAGLIAFAENLEEEVPPTLETEGAFEILNFLYEKEAKPTWGRGTNISVILERLNKELHPRKLVFLLSDFLTVDLDALDKFWQKFSGTFDFIPIVMKFPREYEEMKGFRVNFSDAETLQEKELHLSPKALSLAVQFHEKRIQEVFRLFRDRSISFAVLENPEHQHCFERLSVCFQAKARAR